MSSHVLTRWDPEDPAFWEAQGRVSPRVVHAGPLSIDRLEVTVGRARCPTCPLADAALLIAEHAEPSLDHEAQRARLDDIAARHLGALPAPVRGLLRGVGVGGQGEQARGSALASYLLFEAPYTCELMALGEADTQARRDEVLRFFGWDRMMPGRRHASAAQPDIALP